MRLKLLLIVNFIAAFSLFFFVREFGKILIEHMKPPLFMEYILRFGMGVLLFYPCRWIIKQTK